MLSLTLLTLLWWMTKNWKLLLLQLSPPNKLILALCWISWRKTPTQSFTFLRLQRTKPELCSKQMWLEVFCSGAWPMPLPLCQEFWFPCSSLWCSWSEWAASTMWRPMTSSELSPLLWVRKVDLILFPILILVKFHIIQQILEQVNLNARKQKCRYTQI